MRKLITLALLFLTIQITLGRTPTAYHVATTGLDSNNGLNQGTAFRTIGKCAKVMVAGDTCYVHAGNYTESVTLGYGHTASGTSWDNPITLRNYGTDTVNWTENTTESVILFNGPYGADHYEQYWIIQGFHFSGTAKTVPSIISGGGDHVRLQSIEVADALGSCVIGAGWYWEFLGVTAHDCGTGTGAVPDHCFYWHGSYGLFDGGEWYHCSGYGIQIFDSGHNDVNGNVIRNVRVHDNYYGTHTVGGGGGGITLGTGSGNVAYNNIVYDTVSGGGNSNVGIAPNFRCGLYGSPCLVLNNTIYGIHGSAITLGENDVPMCDAYNSSGGGLGAPCTKAIIRNNIIYGNQSNDIRNVQSTSTIDHNLFTNPLFTNAAAGDFTLQPKSDAINAGVNLSSIFNTDFAGKLRGVGKSNFDIGAFEYVPISADTTAPVVSITVKTP